MSFTPIVIMAVCLIAGIIIDLLIVVNFLSRTRHRMRFYKEIAAKDNFKPIEADSYVLKTNRFGDIIKNDFLALFNGNVKITGGIMKYNLDEHIVFCDCLIEATDNSGKKFRPSTYNAILHLHKLIVPATLKIHRDSRTFGKYSIIFDNLKFSYQTNGFDISSDTEIKSDALTPTILNILQEHKSQFPFAAAGQRGLLILNDKGWFILSASAYGKDMLESLIKLDLKITEAFSKKHV